MTDMDTPIFAPPESYTHARMLAEIHRAIMDVRNRLEVLELAVVKQARRQKEMEDDGR
jgi:hypothetical protein